LVGCLLAAITVVVFVGIFVVVVLLSAFALVVEHERLSVLNNQKF
jgi:regulator of protease activity HflC (stomatin/prohibitin superfamily)